MTLEQRVRKLERLNRILLVGLMVATITLGAFAATRSGTIRADRIITGPKGVWFEAPDGGEVARIAGSQAGGSLIIFGPDRQPSVSVVQTTVGGQVLIWGDEAHGGMGPALAIGRNANGGRLQLNTLRDDRRATLEAVPDGPARLTTWSGPCGHEELVAEWP